MSCAAIHKSGPTFTTHTYMRKWSLFCRWFTDCYTTNTALNTLRPRQNGRHFADDTFNRIFVNENVIISNKISLKFVPEGPINNIPALVKIMAWRRPGDKPLSEPMMVRLPTHICVTRPQWVNSESEGCLHHWQWCDETIRQTILHRLWVDNILYFNS